MFVVRERLYAHPVLSSVTCLPVSCLSTLSNKRYEFRGEKFIEHKMRVVSLQMRSEILFIIRKIW